MDFKELYREEVANSLRLEQELVRVSALLVAIVNKLREVEVCDDDFVEGELKFDQSDSCLKLSLV